MNTHDSLGDRGIVASAVAVMSDWLLEPAEAIKREGGAPLAHRPVVTVIGLAARCGATTVARALGTELAGGDPDGACAVTSAAAVGGVPLGLPAAGRLARRISPLVGARAQACGRLCLVPTADPGKVAHAARHVTPLVIDVHDRSMGAAAAALADHVVLVGSPGTEPALAAVMAGSLRRVGPEPMVVLNRAGRDPGRWAGRGALELPDSRVGAQLALCGRDPRGGLSRAIRELAANISIW